MNKAGFAALAAMVCAVGALAQPPVAVDESKLQAVLRDASTVVSMDLRNSLGHAVDAGLTLSWLDQDDNKLVTVDRPVALQPGESRIDVPLKLPSKASVWLRLSYSLKPSHGAEFPAQQGVVGVSQIAAHVFEIETTTAGYIRGGRPFTIHARAEHPRTHRQVAGVQWSARLESKEGQLQPTRVVDRGGGFVDFVFEEPTGTDPGSFSGDVEISAALGDFRRTETTHVFDANFASAQIQTDKPIYQPGQTMHMRALVLSAEGKPDDGARVTLTLQSEEYDEVHSVDLTASRFGIVSNDWTLPDSAEPGDYTIDVSSQNGSRIGSRRVRVSRYELPTFNVSVKPGKSAYLPGETASVEIRGAYFFGKPVSGGNVRLERDDQTVASGQADAMGAYSASIDLSEDFAGLGEQQRFDDLHYAAYFTDPGSGRTEQRKFDIRITREPIHVYVVFPPREGPLPEPVYVSTFYADGRPAETQVQLTLEGQSATVRTNRFGVAKATLLPPSSGSRAYLLARAADSSGTVGTWTEQLYTFHEGLTLRQETPRTLYRAGEPVTVHLKSPGPQGDPVLITALVDLQPVAEQTAAFAHGEADVTFPYQTDFHGSVTFVAWSGDKAQGSRTVIFPDNGGLRVSLTPGKPEYRPGERADLKISVTSSNGAPVESVLGLAVVDEAVTERARADQEFGARTWFFCSGCGGQPQAGGVSLEDLYRLDPSKPRPDGLDLLAEMLCANANGFSRIAKGENLFEGGSGAFAKTFAPQVKQLQTAIDAEFLRTLDYPRDTSSLITAAGTVWLSLHDPWGMQYRAKFTVRRDQDVLEMISSGPDKTFGTADDFTIGEIDHPYFLPLHHLIEQVLAAQTDYPASEAEFTALLAANGLQFEKLVDPWGTPYRARVATFQARRTIMITSAGPDRRFDTPDDVFLTNFQGRYFSRETAAISQVLSAASPPPATEYEFRKLMEASGIDISLYRDAWGHPYRLTISESAQYEDQRRYYTVRSYQGPVSNRFEITPATQYFRIFALRSLGADGIEDTRDDFDIAGFPVLVRTETTVGEAVPRRPPGATNGGGSISGTVVDQAGAVIPNAAVTIDSPAAYETRTNTTGEYRFEGLPDGFYSLRVQVPGFNIYQIIDIPVAAGATTDVPVTLQVGQAAESVTVTATAPLLATEASAIAPALGTPRVRDYFPETLYWTPELLTDAQGRARAQFLLADSVTNWRIAAIASTLDGRVAEADADLRAFQPFFLEFNPPPELTSGDRVDLPVTVRNYTDNTRTVALRFPANDWSEAQSPAARSLTVAANSSSNVAYSLRATRPRETARQRITASAGNKRDAIEKSLRVHPDGQEISQTFGDLVSEPLRFPVNIPRDAIPGASRGELRLYPSLLSLLLDSARDILEAPHGCAEQTISAGYSNLTALRFARAIGASTPRIEQTALANIETAKDALARFEDSSGGVRYWDSQSNPDIAVTAYALTFLADASPIVKVDMDEMARIADWLEKQQNKDGRWGEPAGSARLTALAARALAAAQTAGVTISEQALASALRSLLPPRQSGVIFPPEYRARNVVPPEPYTLALTILAAIDSPDAPAEMLAGIAREEKGGLFWDEPSNTPFFGWGNAGRLETSALAVSALARWRARHTAATDLDPVIRRGLLFLLRFRDASGGWYSTQATLRAMQAVADAADVLGNLGGRGGGVEVLVNGKSVKTVPFPDDPRSSDPLLVDVSAWLAPGENRVELIPTATSQTVLMRLTVEHWVPWVKAQPRNSSPLRFKVDFDKTSAPIGQAIECSVTAERVGFRGYGMMLAEIGLPPGAEVDRASLESIAEVYRYEVRPDRVIFYLWPTAGGVTFRFRFRPRLAMAARSEPSRLYDYYSPDSLTEIAPRLFEIQ